MTVVVGAGFWMVLQTSPFIIWLAGSVAYLINQGIGCIQIMLINNRRLHPEFHVGKINILLPLATLTRWAPSVSGCMRAASRRSCAAGRPAASAYRRRGTRAHRGSGAVQPGSHHLDLQVAG